MKRNEELETQRADLLLEIRGLREQANLGDEVVDLKKKIADLEIRRDKLTEDHEREKREITHMIGLEKKRQAFEIDQAKRETTVAVREENLKADRKRFEEQMKFTTDRFESEVKYLKELMGEVLDRLPTVTVDKTVNGHPAPRARVAK